VFVVVILDAQNRVLATEELFRGTLTQTSVYPKEVVKVPVAAS
jgi:DNA repair protein RadC